jgi:hypothetical protein
MENVVTLNSDQDANEDAHHNFRKIMGRLWILEPTAMIAQTAWNQMGM